MKVNPVRFLEGTNWKSVELDNVKEGMYYINEDAVVVNKRGKEIKPNIINTDYETYRLYSGHPAPQKYKHVLRHRLVMQTFNPIDNPEEMTVNHKDANKHNNHISNLEWATQHENNMHKINLYREYGSGRYNAAFTKDQLRVILTELDKGTRYTDILIKIGLEPNDNNRDYVGNIKRGITYQKEIEEIKNEDGSSTIES